MLLEVAVIVVTPAAAAVATPELLIVAMVVSAEVQVTELVKTVVEPSV